MFGHGRRTTAAILGLAIITACTYHPSLFPMYGTTADRSRLTGEWVGELVGIGPGWHGSIGFHVDPGRDSARGDASLSVAWAWQQAPRQERSPHARAPMARVVDIGYVRAGSSSVEGVLEPFHDPDCDCVVSTSLHGVVRGDSIVGEYVSRGGLTIRHGAWRMSRRAGTPAGS